MKIFRYYQSGDRVILEKWSWKMWRWEYWIGMTFPQWAEPTDRFLSVLIKRNYKGDYMLWKQ